MKGFSACLACSVNLLPVYPTPSSSPSSSPPFPVESSFSKQLVKELSKVAVAAAASIVSRTASGTWWTDDKVLPQLQQFKVAARQRERESGIEDYREIEEERTRCELCKNAARVLAISEG